MIRQTVLRETRTGHPRVFIFGAGGHGRVVADIVRRAGAHSLAGFYDEDPTRWGSEVARIPIFPTPLNQESHWVSVDAGEDAVIVAIGDNHARAEKAKALGRVGVRFFVAIHPSAQIGEDVSIGPGTVVMANAVVNSGARLGAHVIVNTGATVDHDCVVGDFAHIGPGVHLAGDVRAGEGVQFGVGACAIPGVVIGAWSVVGAGSTVVSSVPRGVTAVGSPARPVRKRLSSAVPNQARDCIGDR